MPDWLNFVAYYAVWLAAVIGAGRQQWWVGPLAAMALVMLQLGLGPRRHVDLWLIALSLIAGVAVDGTLAATHVLTYAVPHPALPPGAAPLWILSLWVAFALTLNHSLRWLQGRPVLGVALGAIGGPLAYLAAQRLCVAVNLGTRPQRALALLAIAWGLAVPGLAYIAARLNSRASA